MILGIIIGAVGILVLQAITMFMTWLLGKATTDVEYDD